MKIYISADFEGINGVANWNQALPTGGVPYENARKQLHAELNTIITALLKSGKVEKIILNDAHAGMHNIMLSEIPPQVELITGKPKEISMLYGLDNTYDCVFFIAYHVKAGAERGVLPHTFSTIFRTVKLNGKPVNEAYLNAVYVGLLGIPVVFATGDDALCDEIKNDINNNIICVQTKKAVSGSCAVCRPNEELFEDLSSAVIKTIESPEKWDVFKLDQPYVLNVDFIKRQHADICSFLPYVKKSGAAEIEFQSDKYEDVYKFLQFLAGAFS
jgi:D-amino peptidase